MDVDPKVLAHRINNNKYAKSPKGRYSRYKQRAQERGRSFTLTQDFFIKLFCSPCHYCGVENARGLDRKDSDIGYLNENVLPCCAPCNYLKMRRNYHTFVAHIKKIANNLNK